MAKRKAIVAAIEHQENLAQANGSLAEDRSDALDRYLGKPYGNEVEGRSSVVMRDVADTIEWIKPSLMKVFASGDEVVKFEPIGPEDEEQANQETDYCNHVLMQKNNGFLILHDWFHDALLQKNGYVMSQWVEEKYPKRQAFENLSEEELAMVVNKPGVEVVAYSIDPMGGHSVTVKTVEEYGCVKVTNIPPERVLVATDWAGVSLRGCPFVEVIDHITLSDLRQRGYTVEDTIADGSTNQEDEWEEQRRSTTNDIYQDREDIEADPATRRVRVRYVWMNFDADGDGVAELRHIVIVGTTILEDEEVDCIPVAAITPLRIPHEHHGQSIADIVSDLQEIRTTLTRGFLDNMYLANNGRYAIDANIVNLDDMLVSRPGGIVRMNSSQPGSIVPLVHPQEGGSILQAIEYVDTVRENRTGVTKYNQGLNADSLNKTATGITQIMTAAQQRIELIARVFAETGVKELMLLIHATSVKNGRKREMVKLRNKWVPVDPSTWNDRRDVTISVGLGTGNKDQMLQHLMMIGQAQSQGLAIGIATPKNIYNAAVKLTQNAGFKQPDEFWTDPEQNQVEQPPNPEAVKAQAEMQKEQMRLQADQQKFQAQAQLDEQQRQFDAMVEKVRLETQERIAAMQESTKLEVERMRHEHASALEGVRLTNQMQSEREAREGDMAKEAFQFKAKELESGMPEIVSSLQQTMQALMESLNRPKQVIRGPDGKVIGVQ